MRTNDYNQVSKPTQKSTCQMTIKNYSHMRLVLSQPVMSAAPALLLFEHHCRWAGALWCCGGPAPVPVSRNPMLTARNAKKEKQNSKGPTRFQTDPSTPDGQVMQEHSIEWCMHMNSHRQLQSLHTTCTACAIEELRSHLMPSACAGLSRAC